MSGRVTIRVAAEEDRDIERGLRDLVYQCRMESRTFQLGYRRDPDFFAGLGVEGTFRQVVVGVEPESGQLVGCFTRTTRPLWVDGREREIGYLGGVRILPAWRGGTLFFRGWRKLRELHADGRCPFYVTTILEENEAAREILTSHRVGMPVYRAAGRYVCTAVVLGRAPREAAPGGLRVVRGTPALLPAIVACLRRNGARRQFAPAWREEDFGPDRPQTRDFAVEDFFVAMRGDHVVGVVGKWDQAAYKQTMVEGYGGAMRLLRPLWDLVAPCIGCRRLPAPGEELPYFFASFLAADDDDPRVLRSLLAALRRAYAHSRYAYFVVGLHEADPLLPVAREPTLRFTYASRLFVVFWEDGEAEASKVDGRPPYLEAATL